MRAIRPVVAIFLGALFFNVTSASEIETASLVDLSLEQLGNIEVTSVSRRAERLSDAAAAIYVISAEDIRRSGAATLPEVLRLAPNLIVARADANQYAISSRGFNSVLANKLLVLIDGRVVYSPLFSGVFWEAQDVMLEDIERIEVISGPGGTLWGTNAVNGVINIITRPASATPGGLVALGGGPELRRVSARYGGTLGTTGHYRAYGGFTKQENTSRADGTDVRDASDRGQAGFRADWTGDEHGLALLGNVFRSDIEQVPGVRELTGVNLLGRWNRNFTGGSTISLQAYLDRTERDQPGAIHEKLNTVDFEIHHGFRPLPAHNLMWGGGYRFQADRVENLNPAALAFRPADRDLKYAHLFAQDGIALRPDLDFTLGLKLEHNDYTGTEVLPNLRLAWKTDPDRLIWGAVSRAVRAPSRVDRELFIPGNPPYLFSGGPDFRSEVSNVAELGFRGQIGSFSGSITAYHHDYDRLRSLEPTANGFRVENRIEGKTTGASAWANYRVNQFWRLSAGMVQEKKTLELEEGSQSVGGTAALGNDPNHWWLLRSLVDIGPRHELDVTVRHTGSLPNPSVPGYTLVNARFGWQVLDTLELSVAGNNLVDPHHPEWGPAPSRAEFDRNVFVGVLWRI